MHRFLINFLVLTIIGYTFAHEGDEKCGCKFNGELPKPKCVRPLCKDDYDPVCGLSIDKEYRTFDTKCDLALIKCMEPEKCKLCLKTFEMIVFLVRKLFTFILYFVTIFFNF